MLTLNRAHLRPQAYGHSRTPYLSSIKLLIPVIKHGLGPGQPAVFDGILTDC